MTDTQAPEPPQTLTRYKVVEMLSGKLCLVGMEPHGGVEDLNDDVAVYLASEVEPVLAEKEADVQLFISNSTTLGRKVDEAKATVATLTRERDAIKATYVTLTQSYALAMAKLTQLEAGQASGAAARVSRAERLAASDKFVIEAREGEKRMLKKLEEVQRENYELRAAGGGVSPDGFPTLCYLKHCVNWTGLPHPLNSTCQEGGGDWEAKVHALPIAGHAEHPSGHPRATVFKVDVLNLAAGGGVSPHLSDAHCWELERLLTKLRAEDAGNFPLIQALEAAVRAGGVSEADGDKG